MRPKSLRRELLAWLVLPLAAVVSLNIWTTYNNALDTANLITETHAPFLREGNCREPADNIRERSKQPFRRRRSKCSRRIHRTAFVYRVTAPRGELLAGNPDVLVPPGAPQGLQPLYFDSEYRNEPVRAVVIAQPVVGSDNPATRSSRSARRG